MTEKLIVFSRIAFFFILASVGIHVAGFLTSYWFKAKVEIDIPEYVTNGTNQMPNDLKVNDEINFGLWWKHVYREGGLQDEGDSPIINNVDHIIILTVACTNILSCFIIAVKSFSVCVGLTSFVIAALMLISTAYTYEGTESLLQKLKDAHPEWGDSLTMWWSFYMVFGGLILNAVSTLLFLLFFLLYEEEKATVSSKGLGPSDKDKIIQHEQGTSSKEVYTIPQEVPDGYENLAMRQIGASPYDELTDMPTAVTEEEERGCRL